MSHVRMGRQNRKYEDTFKTMGKRGYLKEFL
jgi:hypothetical protein